MNTVTPFIIGFFIGGMAATFICFFALTVYFYKLGDDAQKEIYGNDQENTNEADTS